ncbi:FxLD family lanthipeptide [Dactylosporangium sp. CA-233914]|uniref:FxLD family lanthipeptide n=1 Tax=Dactylosporangium sp. CA-233914 TaxID=3239934 RepID=UPI003D8C9046
MNDTENQEFQLDVTLVDAGPAATGYATGTGDGCGSGNTGSNACTTNCNAGS